MTEDEAKKKWCPDSLVVFVNEPTNELSPGCNRVMEQPKSGKPPFEGLPLNSYCIGSACMAWRWEQELMDNQWSQTDHGYCGRAGKP